MLKIRFLILLPAIIAGCRPSTANHFPNIISAEVTNPLSQSRKDVAILIDAGMPPGVTFMVRANEVQLAAQRIGGSIFLVLDSMKANEKRTIAIYYNDNPAASESQQQYRKRTQAEQSQRAGLESEKIAYRVNPDHRNTIGVFGKKTSDLVLMGIDDPGSGQSWGTELIKSGESLGLGSIGMWDNDRVVTVDEIDSATCSVNDGLLFSEVTAKYYGWKTSRSTLDVASELSIHAGTRLASQHVNTVKPLCTGIDKHKAANFFKQEPDGDAWGYIATYGKQSADNDNLGLVVLFSPSQFVAFREDARNNAVELKPVGDKIDYSFAAAWEQEPNGIKNEADFMKWVKRSARELANPVIVHVK
jgi:hypothetical protein